MQDIIEQYWAARKSLKYTRFVQGAVVALERGATSALDVGARGTPLIEAFTWISDRTTLDLQAPYSSPNVKGITVDFFEFRAPQRYDLVTCLQVLEHIPDAGRFARKLFEVGDRIMISVPFKWAEGECKYHVHDPVDFEKLESWTQRKPLFRAVITEKSGIRRAVAYYREAPLNDQEKRQIQNLIKYFQ